MLDLAKTVSIMLDISHPAQHYRPSVAEDSGRLWEAWWMLFLLAGALQRRWFGRSPGEEQAGCAGSTAARCQAEEGAGPVTQVGEKNIVRNNKGDSPGKKAEAIWIQTKHILRWQMAVADNPLIQGPGAGLSRTKSGDGKRFAMVLPNLCWLFHGKLSFPISENECLTGHHCSWPSLHSCPRAPEQPCKDLSFFTFLYDTIYNL